MSTPSTTVTMLSPTGVPGEIPVERADEAEKAGFKRGVNMISPSGKSGVIPVDRAVEAQKNGFKQAGQKPPDMSEVNRYQGILATGGPGFVPPKGSATVGTASAAARGGWGAGAGPREKVPGETMEQANADARDAAITAGTSLLPFGKVLKPIAEFAGENVLPAVEHLPYVGSALRYAENAPSFIKAAARGGAAGAATGAVTEGIRTKSPIQAAKGALFGGTIGAIAGGGAYGLGKLNAPAEAAATELPYVNQGPPVPAPEPPPASLAKIPGRDYGPMVDLGKQAPGGPNMKPPTLQLPAVSEAPAPPAAAAPEELPKLNSMDRLKHLIETEGAGTPPLKKNVPLGDQLFTPPKPTEMPSVGQKVSDVVNKNTETEAVRPLASGPQKNTPLKEITAPPAEPVTHRATVTHEGKTFGMEAANGRGMFEATQDDTAMAKQVHDLRNNDVRQAFLNAGGDVNTVGMEGQRYKVGSSTVNERTQMFDWMLKKGLSPQKIVELARQPIK